jgi:hypothetical protein
MTNQLFAGQHAQVYVSDPWEFGTACGVGPFATLVREVRPELVLLTLETPIDFQGPIFAIVARPRHSAVMSASASSEAMAVNLNLLRANVLTTRDLREEDWRNSVAALGSVRLAEE